MYANETPQTTICILWRPPRPSIGQPSRVVGRQSHSLANVIFPIPKKAHTFHTAPNQLGSLEFFSLTARRGKFNLLMAPLHCRPSPLRFSVLVPATPTCHIAFNLPFFHPPTSSQLPFWWFFSSFSLQQKITVSYRASYGRWHGRPTRTKRWLSSCASRRPRFCSKPASAVRQRVEAEVAEPSPAAPKSSAGTWCWCKVSGCPVPPSRLWSRLLEGIFSRGNEFLGQRIEAGHGFSRGKNCRSTNNCPMLNYFLVLTFVYQVNLSHCQVSTPNLASFRRDAYKLLTVHYKAYNGKFTTCLSKSFQVSENKIPSFEEKSFQASGKKHPSFLGQSFEKS